MSEGDNMVIGMRVIKTAIAMAIGVLVSSKFHLQYPFFTVIAAIIAMQNTLDDSFKKGLGRISGTILGGIAGIIYLNFCISEYIVWNAVIIGILAVLIMYVQLKLKWNQSIQISLIVFLSICLTTRDESVSYYAIVRVLDTVIGIGIAFAVNYLISPPNYEKQFVDDAEQLFMEEKRVFLQKLSNDRAIDIESLEQRLSKIKRLYKIYLADSRWYTKHLFNEESNSILWDEGIRDLNEVYRHICIMQELQLYGKPDEENIKRLQRMGQNDLSDLYQESLHKESTKKQKESINKTDVQRHEYYNTCEECLEEETKVIYNYHIHKILDGLERLEKQLELIGGIKNEEV